MILGLGAAYLIRLGFYPVAVVNSTLVSARTFQESVASANHYFEQVLKTKPEGSDKIKPRELTREIRRATLDKMIENVLVYEALTEDAGNDLPAMVEARIDSLNIKTADFEKAVGTLYGLTRERFRTLVLVPQARQEILASRVSGEAEDLSDWLKARRKKAVVYILARDLYWNGTEVLIK